jgi:hypothetical protein
LRTSVPVLSQPPARTGAPLSVIAAPSDAGPGDPVALNTPATWLAFGYLLIVVLVLAFARWLAVLAVLIAAAVVFFRALFWLAERYPRTMFVLTCFLRGFFGGRRW